MLFAIPSLPAGGYHQSGRNCLQLTAKSNLKRDTAALAQQKGVADDR